jgi:hypothetical protein
VYVPFPIDNSAALSFLILLPALLVILVDTLLLLPTLHSS